MSDNCIIPSNYESIINIRETQRAVRLIKEYFQVNLARELNLLRILFVNSNSETNEGLEYDLKLNNPSLSQQNMVKWKKMTLAKYGFSSGEGFYTNLNTIRLDGDFDNLHSIYADQWDWERIIAKEEGSLDFLQYIVKKIFAVIKKSEYYICENYPLIKPILPDDIRFFHAKELEEEFPKLPRTKQETLKNSICREYGTVFLIDSGSNDDFSDENQPVEKNEYDLRGDILVWYPLLNRSFEVSSIGIRIESETLHPGESGYDSRTVRLSELKLPPTIGGGIEQSRLCMFFLRKVHIGEVQPSIWPEEVVKKCHQNNVVLL